MRSAVIAAGVCLLVAVPTASAAPPKSVSGVMLTWPSKTVFASGERVSLGVKSSRRSARVAFLEGRRVLASRTLRRGTFSVVVPRGDGKTYTLRVTIAGRRFSAAVTTAPRPVGAPVVAPSPRPEPQATPPVDCSVGPYGGAATATLGPLSGRPSDQIRLTIATTGPGCTTVEELPTLSWARLDGTPVSIELCSNTVLTTPPPQPTCATVDDFWELPPGQTVVADFQVPYGLQPGTYEVTTQFTSAEFAVLASATS
jgi:hypothetical protein